MYREICREIFPDDLLRQPLSMSPADKAIMENLVSGIEESKPLQYILGKSWFMGLEMEVNPSVLIPRPETEELLSLLLQTEIQTEKKLLDLCTGSACLALAAAKFGKWQSVEALDVSEEALQTARRNVEKHRTEVSLFHFDLLLDAFPPESRWDVWVSNPPYVAKSESSQMEKQVLEHEPHIALFVPDEDALCFYRRILELSEKHLNPKGKIFLEINPLFSEELRLMYRQSGWFSTMEIRRDMSGKERFLIASKMV